MATKSPDDEEFITLELENSSSSTVKEVFLSVMDIYDWDLRSILSSRIVRIRAHRDRLMESSRYFEALLSGSYSESSKNCISVRWDLESFITILQFIYGYPVEFTLTNFLSLLEGSLYFGVQRICLECESWLCGRKFVDDSGSLEISLPEIIVVWNFGIEHGIPFILDYCSAWLAQNFAEAASYSSFDCIPDSFLESCIKHPQLTVESEKQLCEALVTWITNNVDSSPQSADSEASCFELMQKVRPGLLPLGFILGLSGFPSLSWFAAKSIHLVLDIISNPPMMINSALSEADYDNFKVRLTQNTKKLDFSGCPQVTGPLLVLSLLQFPYKSNNFSDWVRQSLREFDRLRNDKFMFSQMSLKTATFEAVCEVNFSKCPGVHFSDIVNLLNLSFPSLRIFRASYNVHLNLKNMLNLLESSPLISEMDLSVDCSPVMLLKASILSSVTDGYQQLSGKLHVFNGRPAFSKLTKLSLEGRTELRGCTSLTDMGISKAVFKFKQLSSIIAADTYFGDLSISCLCSGFPSFDCFTGTKCDPKHLKPLAFTLQQLDVGGCRSISQSSLVHLLEHAPFLKELGLRDTALGDDVLYHFVGCSLEALDICETMVSRNGLAYIIRRNPKLIVLKAKGCRQLSSSDGRLHSVGCMSKYDFVGSATDGDNLDHALSRVFTWEELRLGWGFYPSSLKILEPSIQMLKAINVGVGAQLGELAVASLPKHCPLLESVSLCFQVISDSAVRNIFQSLKNLQVFELCCCLGDLTSDSFKIILPNLRRLKLQRVTPWMTDMDLILLTQSCRNLSELSLSGCKLLSLDSQGIISRGWPGLSLIHLEDCGNMTLDGISSLMDCKAVEDLLLRHNGPGIPRNFIVDAASKLPLLRKLALDLCDARDGGFDSPSATGRFFLRTVTIARCRSERCAFVLPNVAGQKHTMHKESIVLEWNSEELRTYIVEERV
ncbi:BTB/POZ domain-containing protein FBL11 isoform X2 [Nymphaea colorata]|uniref:BTB/POZ domain-containing protein FBL11 isoform X2 n=1 Tax=Nymphaea colorata TaxID=210225 RepID=UPI00129D5C34|nr:BTB/POZ domain-containing protein FBL11 isoform X2 [Nymphaea colorata]